MNSKSMKNCIEKKYRNHRHTQLVREYLSGQVFFRRCRHRDNWFVNPRRGNYHHTTFFE